MFEISAESGAGQKRAHIQRVDRRALERCGNIVFCDAQGQTFGNSGFANAGIADQKGKQENLEIASASLPRKELEVEEEKVVVKAGRFGGGREKAATMGGHSKVVGKGECSLEAPPPDGARTPVRGECFGWCA